MTHSVPLSVVLPAKNEAASLATLLPELRQQVPDAEIIRWMSCKLTNHRGFFGWLLNLKSRVWCWLVRLKTWEFLEPKR